MAADAVPLVTRMAADFAALDAAFSSHAAAVRSDLSRTADRTLIMLIAAPAVFMPLGFWQAMRIGACREGDRGRQPRRRGHAEARRRRARPRVETITGIAKQTDLLALNAAIEGAETVVQARDAFARIGASVEDMSDRVSEIAAGARELAATAEELERLVGQFVLA